MISRRAFLEAGGLALAGLALGAPLPALAARRDEIVIRLDSDPGGAHVWFDPVGVLVRPGQTVRWVLGQGVHSTTAYPARIPRGAEPWDSGMLMEAGASFTYKPQVEGVYDYFCIPHEAAGMVGRLVVTRAGGRVPSAAGLPDRAPGGRRIPAAALRAFPDVATIVRQGRVSAG